MGKISRRQFWLVAPSVFVIPLLAGGPAKADDLVTKESVNYQTSPYQHSQCSGCKNFVAGATADANGSCKVVAGTISPTGYCVAFSPT